jgi:hypothetical protein
MEKEKKEYFIIVKDIDFKLQVSKRTYYKIFNNEIGTVTSEGYQISLESIKKYKKLYNSIRGT